MGNQIGTLLRLEFKNKFGAYNIKNSKSWLKPLMYFVIFAGTLVGLYYVAEIFFDMFDRAGMVYEALVILFTLVFVFLTIAGISSTSKALYFKGDNEILMRFPVEPQDIFISKTMMLIISQLVLTVAILVPFLVAYGRVTQANYGYYWRIPIPVILCVVIPFLISNLLAIPGMHFTNKIRNKFALIIVLLTLMMVGFFGAYMAIFDKMVTFLKNTEFSVFSPQVVDIVKDVCIYLIPTKYFADVLVMNNLYLAYPILIALTGFSLIGTILIIVKLYQKTLLGNIEVEGSAFKRVTKNSVRNNFMSLLHKEFLEIFRSVNYSFQYFVLASAMPLMVYFCNNITLQLGKNEIGEQITLGITLLVMLIFSTIITSFSATAVSREGNNFYHTKIIPVPVVYQLGVKFSMYFIVSFLANLLCVLVIIFTKQMSVEMAFSIFGIVQAISIALTLFSMKMDIKKPYFNLSGEGEIVNNNINTSGSIGFGLAVALVEGISGMMLGYLIGVNTALYVCVGIAAFLFIMSLITYLHRLKKSYNNVGS